MKISSLIPEFLFITIITSCGQQQQPNIPLAPEIPSVQTFPLKKGQLNTSMSIPGELRPYQEVDLFAKVSGFVKNMTVDIGSEVHKGQLLITLDAPEMTASLQEASALLHTKEAVYRGSKSNYMRLLHTSKIPGTISPNELDLAHAQISADSANLLAARSKYKETTDLRNYLEIRAPFDGVVSSRNVYVGAYAAPADKGSGKPLLTLQEQAKLRLVIAVPEAATVYFEKKDTVHFTVQTLPGKVFVAMVKRLAGSLNTQLRTEQMEMDVNNRDKKLLPGMYAQVNLQLSDAQKVFVVPLSAVAGNSQRIFVIRVNGDKAEWVDVKKGRQSTDQVEIYGDLKEGDHLVSKASDELKNKSIVKIVD